MGEAKPSGSKTQVAVRVGAVLSAAFALSGCDALVLDPAGPVGAAERTMLIDSVVIMLAIIGPIIVATLAFAWWYRADNAKATYRPDWAYSGRIEMVVWSVPLLTITFLGGIAWIGSHQLDPAQSLASKEKPLEVQVVSLDWKWLFLYPEQHVASLNEVVVPAGKPVHFTLTSGSVWDSFFVPRLGSMIYTMNGMATQLNLQADKPDNYYGLSTHLSGDGFSDMHFNLKAVSGADFDSWVKGTQGAGGALDEPAYIQLAKQSIADPPRTYASVGPDLFAKVISQKLAPGPGPHEGPAAPANVSPKGGS